MAHATDDGHEEHTGHGGHHVFSDTVLKRTFFILVGLTVLTVVLAIFERGFGDIFGFTFEVPKLPLGGLSVPVALGIAGAKAYFVAAYFMGLKYEKGTNLLILVGSVVFLVIFFAFTYLDFAFRDTFEELSAIPADVLEAEALAAEEVQAGIQEAFEAAPLVVQPDPELFENPEGPAGPATDAEPVEAIPGEAGPAVIDDDTVPDRN
jgi:caa(3)-type oxidase subunit IV